MIKVLVDRQDYTNYTTIGASFVQRLDEQLDEAQITLVWTNKPEPFVPMTPVGLYDDSDIIAGFIVANDNVTVDTKDPLTYRHELSLIEPTKYLERFKIDGKTFTQPRNEDSGYEPYTLLDVVQQIRNSVPLRISSEVNFVGDPSSNVIFDIPQDISEQLDDIIAPEFSSIKDKTVREALDIVVSEINANVYLTPFLELRLNYFNEQKNQINKTFIERTMERDISQYSTNVISSVMNVVSEDEGGIGRTNEPGKGYYTSTRTENVLWNYQDASLKTSYPIYKVNAVHFSGTLVYQRQTKDAQGTWQDDAGFKSSGDEDFEIVRGIVEEQKKATLDIAREEYDITRNPDKLYANAVLTYTYGQKNIKLPSLDGFLFTTESLSFVFYEGMYNKFLNNNFSSISDVNDYTVEFPKLDNVIYLVSKADPNQRYEIRLTNPTSSDIQGNDFNVYVDYGSIKPTVRMNLEVSGVSETPYKSYITGNQQVRIVDIEKYANKQQARVDRLGLSTLTLKDVVKDKSGLLNLGDFTTDGYIITQREVMFYKDHLEVLYMLNKDFNKLNQFTGIDSQERQWEIAEAGRTVERNINYDEYVELSFGGTGTNESLTLKETGKDKIIKTFDKSPPGILGTNLFMIKGEYPTVINGSYKSNPWAVIPFIPYQGGNSVALNASIDDNISTGKYIDGKKSFWEEFINMEKMPQRPLLYVDEGTRLEDLEFKFYDLDISSYLQNGLDGDDLLSVSDVVPYFDYEKLNNYVGGGVEQFNHIGGKLKVYKDNREKLSFMFAYHLVSNERDLVIGQGLSKRNNLIYDQPNNDLEVRFFDRRFTKRDTMGVGNGIGVDTNALSVSYIDNTLSISTINAPVGAISYAVTTFDGLPLLLVQDIGKTLIRLDFRRFRTGVTWNLKTPEMLDAELLLNEGDNSILYYDNVQTIPTVKLRNMRYDSSIMYYDAVQPAPPQTLQFTDNHHDNTIMYYDVAQTPPPESLSAEEVDSSLLYYDTAQVDPPEILNLNEQEASNTLLYYDVKQTDPI